MPGKVNPVIAESLLMACAQVIGYDAVIAWCAAAGNFELNVMMSVMAYDLLDAIELLAAGTRMRIPMMSISHSDLMPIRTERSDAGLSQCEIVIDIRQEFCVFSLSSYIEHPPLAAVRVFGR